MERHLRDWLICGMHKALWDNIHCLFDDKQITYTKLLVAARKVESEDLEGKGTTTIVKAKASNPKFDNSELCQQVVNLMCIVKSTQTNSTKGQNGEGQLQGKGPPKKRDQGTNGQHPSSGPATTSTGSLEERGNHINAIVLEVMDIPEDNILHF